MKLSFKEQYFWKEFNISFLVNVVILYELSIIECEYILISKNEFSKSSNLISFKNDSSKINLGFFPVEKERGNSFLSKIIWRI